MSILKTTQDFHSQDNEMVLAEIIAQLIFYRESTCKHKITVDLLAVVNNYDNTIFDRSSHFSIFEHTAV